MRKLALVVLATALSSCGSSDNSSLGPQDASAGGSAGGSSTGGNPTGGSPSTGGTTDAANGGQASGGSSSSGGTTVSASGGQASGGRIGSGGASGGNATGGSIAAGGSGSGGTASGGVSGTCLGAKVLADLGKTHVLAGASMEDATAVKVKADLRYIYLSGGIFDGSAPCASCAAGCTTNGTSCANTAGCGWWGCWQYDQDPPGAYVRNFVSTAKTNAQIPMFTYYQILQASGVAEGSAEVGAANNATFMARYFADFRFVLQNIGSDVALVHIEPDLWGYAEQVNSNPHLIPAAIVSANPTDCTGTENSIAGLGHCMITMARKYAPKVHIGLHASGWGTNMDVLSNTSASFNVPAEAKKLADFLVECGAATGDFLVVDASDRDAGYYQSIGRNTWWDATNATLPNFTQAFTWAKALAEEAGTGVLWWQLPVGNMNLPNQTNAWKDNRVDYFFGHTADVAASHAIGMAFGAGEGQQTTPESDGGNLVSKLNAYAASGGQAYCP
jgi:hypothetical protein